MSDLVNLLEACHFRLLSAEDWDTAQAEEFTVRLCLVHMMLRMLLSLPWTRLDKEELRFMSDLVEACHFRLLSAKDWDTAQAEEFTVCLYLLADFQVVLVGSSHLNQANCLSVLH